jgi:hypothetical protein
MLKLCAPALIYVAFSLTQIIIDTFKGLYNTALFKVVVMVVITILLNALCQAGMGIVSWVIVFVPFILMSVIVAILLYVFGLDPATGQLKLKCSNCDSSNTTTKSGNMIYSSAVKKPTPKLNYIDVSYSDTPSDQHDSHDSMPPLVSSDPQFE